jgi:CBS domain-containing protein
MRTLVSEVMTSPALVISARSTFKQAVTRLQDARITAAPVVDDDHRVVGVVSVSDLMLKEERERLESRAQEDGSWAARTAELKAAGRTVQDVMSRPAIVVRPLARVDEAARIMRERGLHRLPVVDEGDHPVGVVTRGDLLKVFLRSDDELQRDILDGLVVSALSIDPSELEVTVAGGVVRLAGRVQRRSDASRLKQLVPLIDGVVAVDSTISYAQDDAAAPAASWRSRTGHAEG